MAYLNSRHRVRVVVIVSVFILANRTRDENEGSGELSGLIDTERICVRAWFENVEGLESKKTIAR